MQRAYLNTRLLVLIFLLVLSSAYAGWYFYNDDQVYLEMLQARKDSRDVSKAVDLADFRKRFSPVFRKENQIGSELHKDKPWHRIERQRIADQLKGRKFDYIILPIEEVRATADRTARLAFANAVATELSERTNATVMAPEIAYRALGGKATHFDDNDVAELATAAGAHVIRLYHDLRYIRDRKHRIAAVLTKPDGGLVNYSIKEEALPADAQPLELVLDGLVEHLVTDLLSIEKSGVSEKLLSDYRVWQVPASFHRLIELANDRLNEAVYLQFMALLTPKTVEYERRRLFEKSLYALQYVDPDSYGYKLLKARALFHLYRRPSALASLEGDDSIAAEALAAFLNGNYNKLKELTPKIESPLLRISSFIELSSLHYSYDQPGDLPLPEADIPGNWETLILFAARDADAWNAPPLFSSLHGLNGLFDPFDQSLNGLLRGRAITDGFGAYIDDTLLATNLITNARVPSQSSNCCYVGSLLGENVVWRFYQNHITAILLKQLNRSVNIHGSYDTAKELAEKLLPFMEGHPKLDQLYASALIGVAKRSDTANKPHLHKKALQYSDQTVIDAAQFDRDVNAADTLRAKIPGAFQAGVYRPRQIEGAVRSAFPSSLLQGELFGSSQALPYTNDEFISLERALYAANNSSGKYDLAELELELENRFSGHPRKVIYKAERLVNKGDSFGAISYLEKALSEGNEAWKTYEMLGDLLIRQGEFEEAKEVYLSYPQFINPEGANRVGVTNGATIFGDQFFWLGLPELAEPFYELAASLNTGAERHYSSAQRLSILGGDYRSAMMYALKRGQRYNSVYGYRDYLIYLHMFGFHDDSDAGFKALVERYDSPPLWTSKFVGQRIQKYSLSTVFDSIEELRLPSNRNIDRQVSRFAFLQSIIDRSPNELEPDKLPQMESVKTDRRFSESTVFSTIVNPDISNTAECLHTDQSCENEAGLTVRTQTSEYLGFIAAYKLLSDRAYSEALQSFIEYDGRFGLLERHSSFALPYAAIAVARSSDRKVIKKLIEHVSTPNMSTSFDRLLAQAVLEAELGDLDGSIDALEKAYIHRPHTKWRPLYSWYQLTDIAERLYLQTNDRRYLNLAVEWAKRYQRIQPHFAWAFAFEALYGTKEEDRIKAAGVANFLDEQSNWLQQVPEAIRAKGIQWWDKNNYYEQESLMVTKEPDSA